MAITLTKVREFFHMSIVKRNQAKALQAKLEKQDKIDIVKPVNQQSQAAPINEKGTEVIADDNVINANKELELYGVAIDADKSQLKKFSTIEEKHDYKAQAIENTDYIGFIAQYIKTGANYPNRVFAWVFVWLVDLGRWQQALNYLPLLVKQQQPLPTQFNTKEWTTFFIDQLYDAGARALHAQQDEPNAIAKSGIMKVFNTVIIFVEQEKPLVPDLVLGKLYAMAAKLEFEMFNFGNAFNYSQRATKVNDKAGVKGLTKKIIALIEANAQIMNKDKQTAAVKKQPE